MGALRGLYRWIRNPSVSIPVGVLLVGGFVFGVLFWGGFNWGVELSNQEAFCISCHEMQTPYEEMQSSIHYANRSGIRATCADCHVPREWLPKMKRKIEATAELWHKAMGKIDTPEKYEQHRLALAQRVWDRMKADDSLACRNCHVNVFDMGAMQKPAAAAGHQAARSAGMTCIECHKGIAHRLPVTETGTHDTAGAPPSPSDTDDPYDF